MQEAVMAERIVYVPFHFPAISLETLQFKAALVPYLAEHVQVVTPEKVVQSQVSTLPHHLPLQ
jgi:hypothetical protein